VSEHEFTRSPQLYNAVSITLQSPKSSGLFTLGFQGPELPWEALEQGPVGTVRLALDRGFSVEQAVCIHVAVIVEVVLRDLVMEPMITCGWQHARPQVKP